MDEREGGKEGRGGETRLAHPPSSLYLKLREVVEEERRSLLPSDLVSELKLPVGCGLPLLSRLQQARKGLPN